MVPFSIGEEGNEQCHPLATVWAVWLRKNVINLVKVKDAVAAEDVPAVCLHSQPRSFVANRTFFGIGTNDSLVKRWMHKIHLKT